MDQKDMFSMKSVTVISTAPLIQTDEGLFMYKPYETEMQMWARNTDNIIFCCPVWKEDRNLLKSEVSFKIAKTIELVEFDIKSFKYLPKVIRAVFSNFFRIFKVMQAADHLHLRCPGNVGLIACMVQVFFPKKKKTVKYAGNWDLKAKQPWSYRLQKWILNNTFLTKNMQVLVYGEWEGSSKNIKPFFTATYSELEKEAVSPRNLNEGFRFIFVGLLTEGKRPLYAVQLVDGLLKLGVNASLHLYGEGVQRSLLESYIATHHLEKYIQLEGNQSKEVVLEAYKNAHFLILPSKSEGWPKVVAEAMFWGCLPVATAVSCVKNMLDSGNRGILLSMDLEKDIQAILWHINHSEAYQEKSDKALSWSQDYTIEKFESEIKKLL